jgi:hypothetical protein
VEHTASIYRADAFFPEDGGRIFARNQALLVVRVGTPTPLVPQPTQSGLKYLGNQQIKKYLYQF